METALYDSAAVASIVGWTNVIRGFMPDSWSKYLPIFAIVFGVLYAIQLRPEGPKGGIIPCLLTGGMLGLSAAGAYRGSKVLTDPQA